MTDDDAELLELRNFNAGTIDAWVGNPAALPGDFHYMSGYNAVKLAGQKP